MSFNNIDQTNYLSYKFVEASFEEFCKLCQPLMKLLNLHHFCYLRMYKNGTYLSFSNSLMWQKFYFHNVNDNCLILPGEVPLFYIGKNNEYMISKWPTLSNTVIGRAVLSSNFGDGICVTKYTPEQSERWGFFKHYSEIMLDALFIQHTDLILKYLSFFHYSFNNLVGLDLADKLAIFKNGIIYPDGLPLPHKLDSIDEFLKDISMDNINSHICIGNFKFTKREFECLSYLAKGKTIKEIARDIKLSPRTIETYINNIKYKTNYHLRSDLVKLYQDEFF